MQLKAKEVARLLSHNGRVQATAGGFLTNCPGPNHKNGDRNPSLNITERDGKLLWKCYAGCDQMAVKEAIERKVPTLAEPMDKQPVVQATTANIDRSNSKVNEYFASRGIGEATLYTFRIGWDKDQKGYAFPYYSDGELKHVKVRRPDKTWWQTPGGGKHYYNIDGITPDEPVYIVEGEIDALSVFEAGFSNVISVPNGAGVSDKIHPEFISNSFGKLQDATKIIIAVDSDEKGLKLRESIAKIYGRDKCWFVDWPEGTKDANDVLVAHGPMALIECLNEAKPFPIRALQSASQYTKDVFDLYHHGKERGMSTGYTSVDEYYTVVPGELEVVTGIPSSGKTNWIDQICVNLSEQYGTKHAVCSFENPMAQHLSILAEKRAKKSFVGYNGARINEYELSDAIKWIDEHFVFIRFDDDTAPTVDAILEHARVAKIRYGITTLVVDPWNYIEQARKSSQSETEYTSEVLSKLRIFAQNYDVHVWLVAHPPKLQRDKDGQINAPTGYDISGSAHFYNKADVLTVVHRNATVAPQNVELIWRKVRFKMTGTPGQIMVRYNLATGCYEDNHG